MGLTVKAQYRTNGRGPLIDIEKPVTFPSSWLTSSNANTLDVHLQALPSSQPFKTFTCEGWP